MWWRQLEFPEGKSARLPGRKERPSRFRIWEDRWTPEVSGFGERRGDRLLSFLRGRAWWKERLQRNFLSWRLTKNLVNTFASIPRSSYVAKDTLQEQNFASVQHMSKRASLSTKGACAVNLRVPPPNYLESVSCLWSLEGRNEVRRHSFSTVRIGYKVTGYNDLPGILIGLPKIKIKTSKRQTKYHYIQCISAVMIYQI